MKRKLGRRNIISREQILDAALDLIARKDVAACTMADVARALDVSVMALYTYFPSRDALLRAAAQRIFSGLVIPDAGADWPKFVAAWMFALDGYLSRNPAASKLLFSRKRLPEVWASIWLPILRLLARQGLSPRRLSLIAEWFGRYAFEAIAARTQPSAIAVLTDIIGLDSLTSNDREMLGELVAYWEAEGAVEEIQRRSDELFGLSVRNIVSGLQTIIEAGVEPL